LGNKSPLLSSGTVDEGLFSLRDVVIDPVTPDVDQKFTIGGGVNLLGIAFLLPCSVICSINEFDKVTSTALGGKFKIPFKISEPGSYDLLLELQPGPIAIPGLPSAAKYKDTITISGVVPPPEKASIYGIVTDARVGRAIGGVTVTANGYSTITDLSGYYEISELPADRYYECIWSIKGYRDYTARIYLKSGQSYERDVPMTSLVLGPYIDRVDPIRCPVGGTVDVIGGNFNTGMYEVSSYWRRGITFVSLLPSSITSSKLTFNLATSSTLRDPASAGTWQVWVGTLKSAESSEQYSNKVNIELI